MNPLLKKIIIGIGVVLGLFVLIGIIGSTVGSGKKDVSKTASNLPTAAATPTPIPVTAAELVSAYVANQLRAEEMYKGRIVLVSGVVSTVSRSFSQPYVALKSDTFSARLHCFFDAKVNSEFVTLSPGQSVVLKGHVDKFRYDLDLDGCRVNN